MFENELKRRQKGTGFTNLGKIQKANVGAGQQMAGKIAQGIQSAGQNVQQQLGQAQQQFKTGFQESTTPVLGSMQTAGGLIKKPGESDEAYSERIKSQGIDYSEIGKKVSEAKYGGPKGLEDSKNLLGSAVTAGALGGMTTSGLGQQQLAKQFVAGKQGYTRGQGALDQLLLGQSPEAQRQLLQASQSVANLPEQVASARQSALEQAAGMEKGIQKEKARVLGGIQSSIGEIEKRAEERGQQYSRDAARLVELLRDPTALGKKVGEKGTEVSEQQAVADRKLLSDLKRFGIGTGEKIDTSDPQAMISALQEIANKGTIGVSKKYGDVQRGALEKLARFQQDEGKAAQIKAGKDKTTFAFSDEDLKKLTPIQRQETESKKEKENIDLGQRYANLGADYQKILDQARNIPHTGLRVKVEDQAFDQLATKYGFNAAELANMFPSKGQVLAHIQGMGDKLLSENRARQTAREKNQMALQDYINRLYGIG